VFAVGEYYTAAQKIRIVRITEIDYVFAIIMGEARRNVGSARTGAGAIKIREVSIAGGLGSAPTF
jgi:hypothetical protein